MPSLGESFGLMAVEAMACQKPVVVFDNTALPSVTFAPECGVLVENKNSQKLMEAIKMLIEDPSERNKRGELGRKIAQEHYDLNNYNKELLKIYRSALNRKHIKAEQSLLDNNIDEKDIENIKISSKLNILTKKLFTNVPLLNKKHKKILLNDKIDYSNINVQKTLRNYTDNLYNLVLKNKNILIRRKISIHEIFWLLKNDRPKLKATISDILRTKPFIYKCTKLLYKTIKSLKHIYQKYKEIINYLIVGGLTTVISLAVYYISVFTFLNPENSIQLQIANILSWIAGVAFAYFTNRKYVFESKNENKLKEATKFVSSRITTLLLDMLIMWLFVTTLHFNDKIMKLISQVLVVVGNYILSKLFVFKK